MVSSVSGAGQQQSMLNTIAPKPENGGHELGAAGATYKKAQGLQQTIASIVTGAQPLETSGNRGTQVNLLA
jgi:hypothetical protein